MKETGDRSMKRSPRLPHWLQAQSKEAERKITSCTDSRPSRKAQHVVPLVSIERHNTLTSRPSRKIQPDCCQSPIEGQDFASASLQSKYTTWLLPKPNRRTGLRLCQSPIERCDFAAASPNRRRPENANWSLLLPESKDTHFLYFHLYFLCLLICL